MGTAIGVALTYAVDGMVARHNKEQVMDNFGEMAEMEINYLKRKDNRV